MQHVAKRYTPHVLSTMRYQHQRVDPCWMIRHQCATQTEHRINHVTGRQFRVWCSWQLEKRAPRPPPLREPNRPDSQLWMYPLMASMGASASQSSLRAQAIRPKECLEQGLDFKGNRPPTTQLILQ
eukprot:365643-Chlamydomonas_euryale.AAC.11